MNLSRQVTPRYLELAQLLREQLDGYEAGDYLPSEATLAARFGVNRHTLRRAVDELVVEGRVLRRKGRGTCVLPRPIIYPVHAGSAYSKTLERMGYQSEAIVLGRRKRAGTAEEAQALQLAHSEPVLEFETLRLLDRQPISLITHCFAGRHHALVHAYEGGSMRAYLARQGVRLQRMSTLIGARAPSQRDALHLLMPMHTPVLSIRTLSCNGEGASFELSHSITRADRFKYHVTSGEHHEN